MIIKVLGTGCPKCKLLQKTVEEAVKKLGLDCKIVKVDDMNDIMQYDVMAMPALVLDEYLVLSGGVPREDEMIDILANRKIPENSSVCNGGDCPGGCCNNSHNESSDGGGSGGCCSDGNTCNIDCKPDDKGDSNSGGSCCG